MPPPAKWGARIDPWRARPVPFWRHGFAPPPDTLPRVRVEAVPRRRALSSARTVSCTSGMLKRASKVAASSVTVPPPRTGAERSAIGAHLHRSALRTGHGSADEQQVLARDHLDDGQPALRDAATAHPTGSANALKD